MGKNIRVAVILVISTLLLRAERVTFPGELVYDPFFHVTAVDSEGIIYHLTNASFIALGDASEKRSFFFWIRRGTEQGIASYTLDFNRIKSIRFTGFLEDGPPGYCPGEITLVNGKSFPCFIGCEGYLEGFDTDFGSGMRLYLNYNLMQSVTFEHGGVYRRCPYCGVIFYDDTLEVCPFDQTELIPQRR